MPPVSSPTPMPDAPLRLFITGGAGGLGADLVRGAAAGGHDVVFTYHTGGAAAEALVAELAAAHPDRRVRAIAMDQGRTASVDAAIDAALAEVDVDAVICNAGLARTGLLATMRDEDWNAVLDTNLTGTFRVCRRFLMHFLGRRAGRFVLIGSVASGGMAGHAAYAASKAGLEGLSGSIAREYGLRGIRSNVLSLGLFESGMGSAQASDDLHRFWLAHCPERRLGQGTDLTATALFLASEASTFVNGQVINLSGGLDWAP